MTDLDPTKARLLAAAGEIFAKLGFRQATVREICELAGTNVAAVNYHFRDKENLYTETLKYARRCAVEKYPEDLGLGPGASTEDRLFAFIHSFLLRISDPGRPAWHAKLIAREMAEPTAALDAVIEDGIRQHFTLLSGLVANILSLPVNHKRVIFCARSIVGQILFYFHGRAVIGRLQPDQGFSPADIEEMARHIFEFTRFALRGFGGAK